MKPASEFVLQMRAIASIIRLLQCLRTWRVQPSGFRPLRKLLGFWGYVAVAEIFVVLFEAWLLKRRGVLGPLRWSLLANLASMGIGYASHLALGWP